MRREGDRDSDPGASDKPVDESIGEQKEEGTQKQTERPGKLSESNTGFGFGTHKQTEAIVTTQIKRRIVQDIDIGTHCLNHNGEYSGSDTQHKAL